MSSKFIKNNLFLFILTFLLTISKISSQKIKDLQIGSPIKGRMEIDESHEYFKLVLP